MIRCDRCGADTIFKTITAKKDGKKYTICECQGNCMDGRFKHSFFPNPTVPNTSTPTPAAKAPSGESLSVLKSIDASLKNIVQMLQAKTGQMPVQPEELMPDEETPF